MMFPSSGTVGAVGEHAVGEQRPRERPIDADVLLAGGARRRNLPSDDVLAGASDDLFLRRVAGRAIRGTAVGRQLIDARALLPVLPEDRAGASSAPSFRHPSKRLAQQLDLFAVERPVAVALRLHRAVVVLARAFDQRGIGARAAAAAAAGWLASRSAQPASMWTST